MGWKDTIAPIGKVESPSASGKKSWKDTISDITQDSSDNNEGELHQLFTDPKKYAANRLTDAHDQLIATTQGGMFGGGDEILGGLQAGKDLITGDTNLDDLHDTYRKHQKENEAGVDAARARSPYGFIGAELAGGLLPALLTGGGSEAVSGAKAAKTLGRLALEGAGKTGILAGLAGAGGSHGTLDDDPSELVKDTAYGVGGGLILGGAAPIASQVLAPVGQALKNVAGSVKDAAGYVTAPIGNALSKFIDGTPSLKNLNDARLWKKDTGQSFTSLKDIENVNGNVKAIINDISKKGTNLNDQLGDFYGGMLDDGTAAGNELSTSDPELMQKLTAAKDLIASKGGMSTERQAALAKHGMETGDSLSNSAPLAFNPREAKNAQNALRETAAKPAYADSNVLNDLIEKLTPSIDDSMTGELLPTSNAKYSGGKEVLENLINKGNTDSAQQKFSVSDLTPDQLENKIKDYISNVVNKKRDNNLPGFKTNNDFNDALASIKDINKSNQIQYLDPEHLSKSVDEAALQNKIVKDIFGEKTNNNGSKATGIITKAIDSLTGTPMRAALGVGGIQRGVNKGASSIADGGRWLANASNDTLNSVAQTLTGQGHIDIANSLNKALTSQDGGAKNAALFTIMQNPQYREAIKSHLPFMGDDSEGNK